MLLPIVFPGFRAGRNCDLLFRNGKLALRYGDGVVCRHVISVFISYGKGHRVADLSNRRKRCRALHYYFVPLGKRRAVAERIFKALLRAAVEFIRSRAGYYMNRALCYGKVAHVLFVKLIKMSNVLAVLVYHANDGRVFNRADVRKCLLELRLKFFTCQK